jgi:hypothetical protein
MTATELWKLPVPASALINGPDFAVLPRRCCAISFDIEEDDGAVSPLTLTFEAVEAFRATYKPSLDADLINAAYGKLVDLGATSWLAEILKKNTRYYTRIRKTPPTLKHLAICFDDGPGFEIVCSSFRLGSDSAA